MTYETFVNLGLWPCSHEVAEMGALLPWECWLGLGMVALIFLRIVAEGYAGWR